MEQIARIPKLSVPGELKSKWERMMLATRSRTAKLVVYGKRFLHRDNVETAVFEHFDKSEIESIFSTTSAKEFFVTFKSIEQYEHFLSKTLTISGSKLKPLPFDSLDIEIRLHWLQEEIPDEMIAFFLEEHCDTVNTIRHETDLNGIKTGVRIANIRLLTSQRKISPTSSLLTKQDPMLITLPGRPPLCLRCHQIGHVRASCLTPFCRHCQSYGHATETCRPSYANATRKSLQKDNQENTDSENCSLFETEQEAIAKSTQEWKEVRRKKHKKPPTPPNNVDMSIDPSENTPRTRNPIAESPSDDSMSEESSTETPDDNPKKTTTPLDNNDIESNPTDETSNEDEVHTATDAPPTTASVKSQKRKKKKR